ncbi:MAG: D-cysteine desulfhydrase [Desulfobacteraceae bacterium]|nr:MAG: D-cysteine desulfhydrase [Desulfobacteraceae bacterium]
MNLALFPRRRYTHGPTPIEPLPRFSAAIGGPGVFIKRDDLLGLAAGGNKTRKLEFLVADALAGGADTLVTCGAIQSNHCRLTLAAAAREGLRCRFILEERIPGTYDPNASGNNLLYHLMGIEEIRVVPKGTLLSAEMEKVALELDAQGRKAYLIPVGGSTPVGATGYAACAQEIQTQSFETGIAFDHIICASGSAGTQAGLVTGLIGCNMEIPVTGINVSHAKEPQEELVYSLCLETAHHLGLRCAIPRNAVRCLDGYVGEGYAIPTPQMAEAVRLLARTEGILLDPVYTGKAMAGLIDLARSGFFKKDDAVLFIHTGGSPALYAYKDYLLSHKNSSGKRSDPAEG